MVILQRLSKSATGSSVLLILLFLVALHPDVTGLVRGLSLAAFVTGWIVAGRRDHDGVGVWLWLAPVVPAVLRVAAGREGVVLDFVWMAGLAGALLRRASWSTWAFPAAWSPLLGGWALALSLSWPVLVLRESAFTIDGLVDRGAINSWAMQSAPQVIGWTLHVVLTQLLGLLWFERARLAFTASGGVLPRAVHALWIGVTTASVVAVIQGFVDAGFLTSAFWASLQRAGGTMLDSNAYGMCAALAAPVAFIAMRARVPGHPLAALLVLGLNWAGVWMSGSRTALLCAVAGGIGLAVDLGRRRRERTARAPLTVAIVVAAVVVAGLASGAVGPIRRIMELPAGWDGVAVLFSRGAYGPIAMQMIREYPLIGVGSGSYHVLAADYLRRSTPRTLPWDNAQNWWRHQLAELGLLGSAPIILFSVLVAWWVVTGRIGRERPAWTLTVRGLLAGLGTASLLGMPTQNPVVLLWFFLLVGWLTSSMPDAEADADTPRPARAGWFVTCGLAVAFAAGHVVVATGSLAVAERVGRARLEYVAGTYPPETSTDGQVFRWTGRSARFVLPAQDEWLLLRFWVLHPDVAANPVTVTVVTPCGTLLEEVLTNSEHVSVAVRVPEGLGTVDLTIAPSRTWRPADTGADDPRTLGVGVVTAFIRRAAADREGRKLTLPACGVP